MAAPTQEGEDMSSTNNLQATNTASLESTLMSTVKSSWSELTLGEGLVHVEYQTGADGGLDFIKIWLSKVWGEWKLVCELWMRPVWSHVAGVKFGSEFHSTDFERTLELAVGSVDTSMLLPNHRGFLQVFPPTAADPSPVGTKVLSQVQPTAA